jgi:cystathionine beta-lyase/cystathionine gamma-synthase
MTDPAEKRLMIKKNKALSDSTEIVHDERYPEGAVAPPIYQTSLFSFEDYQSMVDRYRGDSDQAIYSRIDNPTTRVLQDKIAILEGGDAVAAFSSGMAAISNAILGIAHSGDRIVCIKHVYPDTYRLLRGLCSRLGIVTEFVDGTDTDAVAERLPGAKLLYLESPNTWMMQEQDLRALAKLARAQNVTTIVDNSWATPLFQKPLQAGIDLAVHSASKYISGHSDIVGGLLVGSADLIGRLNLQVRPYLGACLSPHSAALLIRGLRTLPLRMQRHQDSGLLLARKLSDHAVVTEVHHPGLHKRDFSLLKGYGSLFSFEVDESVHIQSFCDALQVFRLGVSWGGYESLVVPAEIARDQAGEFNSAQDFGVPPRLIRLFVGLEDLDDLWNDLLQAFETAGRGESGKP